MQLGRFFGLIFILLGGGFAYFNYTMIRDSGYTIKLFMAGPALIGVGFAMLIFPGGNITAAESRNKEKDPKTWMSEAPALHKVMWAVGGIAGFAINALFFKSI
jgi:hypothetical protein